MKTNSSVLSGKFWLAAVSVALFLLPVTAAAQAANSGRDRRGNINRGRVGVVTTVEPGETLDLNAKLKIRSGGFFLENTALLRAGRGNRLIPSSPPFAAVVLGTTNASDYLVFNAGGAERARISTDGNFGIGTMSPINAGNNARWLTIDGVSTYSGGVVYSVAGTAKGYTYYDDGMNAMGVQSASGVGVALKIGGSAALFVNPSGNVGIGTTTPAVKLAVQNSSSFTGTSGIAGSNATADLYNDTAAAIGEGAMLTFSSNYSGGKTTRAAIKGGSEQVSWDASGYLAFYVNRPPQINTLDEMMRITTAGNVGIGTTSPVAKLSVFGGTSNINIGGNYGAGYNGIWLNGSTAATHYNFLSRASDGHLVINRPGGSDIFFNENDATTDLVIKNGGNVGIGSTGPSHKLQISGVSGGTTGLFAAQIAGVSNGFQILTDASNNLTYSMLTGAGAQGFYQAATGKVGIGATDPGYKLDVAGHIRSRNGGFIFPDGTVQTTAASSGGSSQWSGSGPIYYNGNVGIGISNPADPLHVSNVVRISPFSPNSAGSYLNAGAALRLINGNIYQDNAPSSIQFGGMYNSGGVQTDAIYNYIDWSNGSLRIRNNQQTKIQVGGGDEWSKQDIYLNPTGGKVGIGRTDPSYKLDVYGPSGYHPARVANPDGYLLFGPGNTSWMHFETDRPRFYFNTGLTVDTGNIGSYDEDLNLQTQGTTRLTINNSNGNVGIGMAPSAYKFSVNGEIDATGLRINGVPISSSSSQWTGTDSISYTGGNVGIGTANPGSYTLNVQAAAAQVFAKSTTGTNYATVVTENLGGDLILGMDNSSGGGLMGSSSAYAGVINVNSARSLQLGTNNTTRMTIDSSGNAGFGTTSPTAKLHVFGGSGSSRLLVLGEGAGTGLKNLSLGYDYNNDFGWIQSIHDGSSYTPFVLQSSGGNVGIGTTTPGQKLDILGGNINVSSSGGVGGNITISGTINAKYQDVAEWVPSSEQLDAGTVVVLDSTKSNQVTSSSVSYDTRVAGVISEQPGIALGEKSDNKVLVATTGRVKVKVDASKGPIHIGDLLVTSDVPGVAMKSEPVEFAGRKMHMPGTLIGKALEPLEKGSGEILVLLSLQ